MSTQVMPSVCHFVSLVFVMVPTGLWTGWRGTGKPPSCALHAIYERVHGQYKAITGLVQSQYTARTGFVQGSYTAPHEGGLNENEPKERRPESVLNATPKRIQSA